MNQALSADTFLWHYRIVSRIGAGGMGEVYRCRTRPTRVEIVPPCRQLWWRHRLTPGITRELSKPKRLGVVISLAAEYLSDGMTETLIGSLSQLPRKC
jgi:hypothetical protein